MTYQECLQACIKDVGNHAIWEKLYREYPLPTATIWMECEAEAEATCGQMASAVERMARYELRLAIDGLYTVSALKAEKLVDIALFEEAVPAEIVVATAIRYARGLAPSQYMVLVQGQ